MLVFLVRRIHPAVDLDHDLGAAPDFILMDLDDQPFRLASHRGRVVVVNFWATWCPPCRAEIPGFISLQNEFQDEDVLFVGISLDEDGAEAVRPYAANREINYPILLDGHGVARSFGGVGVLPTTLLIDRGGHIRFRHEGFLLPRALRPAIRTLLEER